MQVSDDEDDTHPNIDTPSLFKWRHEARVQRMQELEAKKKQAKQEKMDKERQLKELKEKVTKAEASSDPGLDTLKKSLKELEINAQEAAKKALEVEKEEKSRPWNVDTLSKDGFSKTIMNTMAPAKEKVHSSLRSP